MYVFSRMLWFLVIFCVHVFFSISSETDTSLFNTMWNTTGQLSNINYKPTYQSRQQSLLQHGRECQDISTLLAGQLMVTSPALQQDRKLGEMREA